MKYPHFPIPLFILFFSQAPAFASQPPGNVMPLGVKVNSKIFSTMPAHAVDDSSCAKVALAAIYGAQRSYWSEYDRYSDSFNEIGYSPEPGKCEDNWDKSIRLFNGGKEFLAEAVHRKTRETWTIDQNKNITQVHSPK